MIQGLLRQPLLVMAILLLAAYITMAEINRGDDGPRTFIAGLAAMTLGAWVYSVARRCNHDEAKE